MYYRQRSKEEIEKEDKLSKDNYRKYIQNHRWQRFLIPLFTFIYWKRLIREHNYPNFHSYEIDKVVHVKGWRTAIISSGSYHGTTTFCFKYFFKN